MRERAVNPALCKQAEHRGRRMGKAPKLPPTQPEGKVFGADEKARQRVARRIAEDEETPSALRSRSQQALIIRVAADDSVQHDDVSCLHALRVEGDVVQASVYTSLECSLAQEVLCLLVVSRRELQVHGAGSTCLQELDLDLTDASTDLEHGRTLDP